ncbi:hypothetical protein FACS1894200_05070 [Spirochaetia bacterium]|nr:hypothetical protein FACS1894200_05070 [Spirochaetia bacterium]
MSSELEQARLQIKKLERELKLAHITIERNMITAASKDSLSKVISIKKSELEKYMDMLLENCPDIILIFDGDGKLVYCTEVFLSAIGVVGFGMIAGLHYREILNRYAPVLIEQAQKIYELKESGTQHLSESIDFARGGNPRDYSIQVSPMEDDEGHNTGAIVIFYDATDLLAAKRDAEKANKAKSDFLATISHEIRTPMNAIIGVTKMLEATPLTDVQTTYLKNIKDSSSVLLTLINDILDFSKIEAGKLEILPDYFNLNALLNRLQSIFSLLFSEKNLEFNCVFPDKLPRVLFGDDKRLGQILTNLLTNALKYTRAGQVNLCINVIDEQKDGDADILTLRFAVEDTGIGIEKDAIPRLFTAFEQLDQVKNKQVQGTGLGLAITKKLCIMMNGAITIESEYEAGSVFSVTLPFKRGTDADLTEDEVQVISFTAAKTRILIVDDIAINLEVAVFMLEAFDIEGDTASSGKEALEKVQSKEYDIIFMDHMMPEMDGIETVKHLRELPILWCAQVPIIALTANAISGAKELFLKNGFNGFLPKPMDNNAIAQVLLRWLPERLIVKCPEKKG